MALINRIFNVSKEIGMLCGKMMNLQTRSLINNPVRTQLSSAIHTTTQCRDLMEFFDDSKNWGENEVKHGRAWTTDELRIKSNVDLHKLWFVLLKERNMLLTMEHECNDKMELFPSPERIDKVKLSMENLETVVRERNRAYHLLETGEDGERPKKLMYNQLGMRFMYRATEHVIPRKTNSTFAGANRISEFQFGGRAVTKFVRLYREKLYNEKRKARNRDRNEVRHILRRFPHVSKDLLAKKYPLVDMAKILRNDEARGHYAPTD